MSFVKHEGDKQKERERHDVAFACILDWLCQTDTISLCPSPSRPPVSCLLALPYSPTYTSVYTHTVQVVQRRPGGAGRPGAGRPGTEAPGGAGRPGIEPPPEGGAGRPGTEPPPEGGAGRPGTELPAEGGAGRPGAAEAGAGAARPMPGIGIPRPPAGAAAAARPPEEEGGGRPAIGMPPIGGPPAPPGPFLAVLRSGALRSFVCVCFSLLPFWMSFSSAAGFFACDARCKICGKDTQTDRQTDRHRGKLSKLGRGQLWQEKVTHRRRRRRRRRSRRRRRWRRCRLSAHLLLLAFATCRVLLLCADPPLFSKTASEMGGSLGFSDWGDESSDAVKGKRIAELSADIKAKTNKRYPKLTSVHWVVVREFVTCTPTHVNNNNNNLQLGHYLTQHTCEEFCKGVQKSIFGGASHDDVIVMSETKEKSFKKDPAIAFRDCGN